MVRQLRAAHGAQRSKRWSGSLTPLRSVRGSDNHGLCEYRERIRGPVSFLIEATPSVAINRSRILALGVVVMAITVPCPQCGKTLKLLETLLGKTIRCPSCQRIFKAPHPSPREEIAEVLPADVSPAPNVFSKRNLKDPPIVNVAPGDTNRESRKTPTAKRGWAPAFFWSSSRLFWFCAAASRRWPSSSARQWSPLSRSL